MAKSFKKFFDTDQTPIGNVEPTPAVKIKPIARRRRYAHTFSAGRTRKLVKGADGQYRWRKVPDGAIVHFGKQGTLGKEKKFTITKRVKHTVS